MSQTLILLRKSLLNFSRARGAVIITFAVPIVLIYLFGHVFGLYRKDSGPSGLPLAVVNLSPEPAAQQLVDALKSEKALYIITTKSGPNGTNLPLTEADVRAALHDNNYRFALILPADLYSDDRIGLRMKFLSNPRNDIEAQTVNGILQKTVFSKVPTLLGQSMQRQARRYLGNERYDQFNRGLADSIATAFGGNAPEIQKRIEAGDFLAGAHIADTTPANTSSAVTHPRTSAATATSSNSGAPTAAQASNANDVFSRIVKIDTEQVEGKEVKNPMAARIVGGYAIMFLLFAVTAGASSMFEEKATGIYQRLLSAPVTPAHILWARFLFGTLLGIVQISALFIAGRIFFQLEIFNHFGALVAVTVAAAAACSGFGLLIAAISPSADAARGLATLLVISMSAVGGAWFPVSFMPSYIQSFSKATIVYWSVEGLTDVLWAGHSLIELLPKIGILAAFAAGFMGVSVWIFNRNKFFEG